MVTIAASAHEASTDTGRTDIVVQSDKSTTHTDRQ